MSTTMQKMKSADKKQKESVTCSGGEMTRLSSDRNLQMNLPSWWKSQLCEGSISLCDHYRFHCPHGKKENTVSKPLHSGGFYKSCIFSGQKHNFYVNRKPKGKDKVTFSKRKKNQLCVDVSKDNKTQKSFQKHFKPKREKETSAGSVWQKRPPKIIIMSS